MVTEQEEDVGQAIPARSLTSALLPTRLHPGGLSGLRPFVVSLCLTVKITVTRPNQSCNNSLFSLISGRHETFRTPNISRLETFKMFKHSVYSILHTFFVDNGVSMLNSSTNGVVIPTSCPVEQSVRSGL